MQPTITIPHAWKYPRITFGQRIEQGMIIGMKYYPSDSLLAYEYDESWRYLVMPNMNSIEEGNHLENDIKLLKPQELKTLLEAEIKKRLYQIEVLKYELKTIPGIVINS